MGTKKSSRRVKFYHKYINSWFYRKFKKLLDKKLLFFNHSINYYMFTRLYGKVTADFDKEDCVTTHFDMTSDSNSLMFDSELREFYYNQLKKKDCSFLSNGEDGWTNKEVREHFLELHTRKVEYGKNTHGDPKGYKYDDSTFEEEKIDEGSIHWTL